MPFTGQIIQQPPPQPQIVQLPPKSEPIVPQSVPAAPQPVQVSFKFYLYICDIFVYISTYYR